MLILDLVVLFRTPKDELLSHMSVDDLVEMAAYKRIKPFGYDMENKRFGQICAAIYNSAGKTYKKEVEWSDIFMPSWGEQKKDTNSIGTLLEVFKGMAERAKKDKK